MKYLTDTYSHVNSHIKYLIDRQNDMAPYLTCVFTHVMCVFTHKEPDLHKVVRVKKWKWNPDVWHMFLSNENEILDTKLYLICKLLSRFTCELLIWLLRYVIHIHHSNSLMIPSINTDKNHHRNGFWFYNQTLKLRQLVPQFSLSISLRLSRYRSYNFKSICLRLVFRGSYIDLSVYISIRLSALSILFVIWIISGHIR